MARDTTTESLNGHGIWEDDERDELEELIAEIAKGHPEFPAMVEAELQRRQEARKNGQDPNDDTPADNETNTEQGIMTPRNSA